MKCDLHLHTDCSDGLYPPEKVVDVSRKAGLSCIAITDHDTAAGLDRARAEGKKVGVKVLKGVELSAADGEVTVHVLGYNFDDTSKYFQDKMQEIATLREARNRRLTERLAEYGMPVDYEKIVAQSSGSGSIGRPAFAREMVSLGYCATVREAFDKFLGAGKPCYVKTRRLLPEEATRFIADCGGIAVLAHPKNIKMGWENLDNFVSRLTDFGLRGIEAAYFTHNIRERKAYTALAKKYHLIVTGGSDFHGGGHGLSIGKRVFYPSSITKKVLGLYEK